MSKGTVFVGMDVHAETIAVAVAEGRTEVRSLGTIANRPEAVRRLLETEQQQRRPSKAA
jgi:transposase